VTRVECRFGGWRWRSPAITWTAATSTAADGVSGVIGTRRRELVGWNWSEESMMRWNIWLLARFGGWRWSDGDDLIGEGGGGAVVGDEEEGFLGVEWVRGSAIGDGCGWCVEWRKLGRSFYSQSEKVQRGWITPELLRPAK
jgi:hypothetical protein